MPRQHRKSPHNAVIRANELRDYLKGVMVQVERLAGLTPGTEKAKGVGDDVRLTAQQLAEAFAAWAEQQGIKR